MEKKDREKRKIISSEKVIRKEWIYPSLIAILGFCYYVSYINYGISLGDEGFFVYGAERVLQGQLPMSDFMAYPPGSYLLLALFFKVFGVNLLVSRLMEMAFLLMNGLMMFYVGRRLMPKSIAVIPSFILIAFPGPWHKVFFTFGLLVPMITLFRFLDKRTAGRTLAVGWATGIALIFKLESALYSLLTAFAVFFWIHIWQEGNFLINKKAILGIFKDLLLCFLAMVSVITPFIIYYHSESALGKLFSSLKDAYSSDVVAATGEFFGQPSFLRAVTKFHIGSLSDLFFYLIILLYLYVLTEIVSHLFIKKKKSFPALLPILIMGMLSLSYAYISFSKSYLLQSAAMGYLLFGFVIYTFAQKRGTKSKVMLIFLISLLGLYLSDSFKWRSHFYSGSISRLYRIEKARAVAINSEKANVFVEKRQADAINELIQYFEGKRGYLLPLYYDPMVNFLTGLENPTRFSILSPILTQDPLRQKRVIDGVERYKVKFLLIRQLTWMSKDSFGFSKYAPILYEFVSNHYKLEKEVGDYLIFSRCTL
jgi:hypothetical protein